MEGALNFRAYTMGFREIGSHIDEEGGTELYFERRLNHWPNEWTATTEKCIR